MSNNKFTTFNLSEELKQQLAFKDDFSSMLTRMERAESKNLEQELRLEYLEGRQGNVKDAIIDLFLDGTRSNNKQTEYSKEVKEMFDIGENFTWKPREGSELWTQGIIKNSDQPYMLEVIDEYNLEGVGQAYKCNLKYDSVNDCYWMISSTGSGAIGEITKLSTSMKDGKIEVLGRWYIPLVTAGIWSGLAVDGRYLYISYYHATTSGIGKIAINSDGTLGKLKNANGSTLILNSTCLEYTLTSITGVVNGLINYSDEEIGYLICATTTVSLVFLAKTGLGAGTTTSITGLGNYVGGSLNHYKSADYKDNILYIRIDDGTDNKRFIYKFNLSSDLTASNVVIKSSGRFENARNVSGNGFGGICFSHDGNLLEVVSTASNGKFIAKCAIKNALWAENQVCSEKKCNATSNPNAPMACMVDPDGNYWTGDTIGGAINTADLYRFDIDGNKHSVRLTGNSLDTIWDLCHDGTNVYLLCRVYSTNYTIILKTTLAILNAAMELVTDYSSANILDTSGWAVYAYGAATPEVYGIAYDSDDNVLLLLNNTDIRIDTLSLDLVTLTSTKYKLPSASSLWVGIAYYNQNIYVGDYPGNTTPHRIFVIPKNKANSTYMWRSHIYQDPSISFASLGRRGLDFDGNDLVTIHHNTLCFYKMKVLEDPDVMQLHTFIDAFNILISSTAKASLTLTSCGNVSCCTPIVERYFDPEYFADIRDCPDKNYMAVGYGDEGFSILHLDKFLSGRSSTGKPRYDVRDIRTQHYKRGANNLIASASFAATSIFIEKDLIILGGAVSSAWGLYVIDLKLGKAVELYSTTNSGYLYTGTLSERNDAKTWAGSHNSELVVSSELCRKIHARTFTKDDASDYSGENPKTFVAIGTDSGCDLLVIDWDKDGNRTPVKVWNALDSNTGMGRYGCWISPSGFIFMGNYADSGGIFWGLDPLWEVVRDNQFQSGDRRSTVAITVGGFVMDISPNSRCWKTPSGTWRHQLVCGCEESTTNGATHLSIVDIENATIEHLYAYDSGVTVGISSVDNFEDTIFSIFNTYNTGLLFHGISRAKKLKYVSKDQLAYLVPWKFNFITGTSISSNSIPARPRFTSHLYTTGKGNIIRYSNNQGILSFGGNIAGLQMFMFPRMNQCKHVSTEIASTAQDVSEVYYKEYTVEG